MNYALSKLMSVRASITQIN